MGTKISYKVINSVTITEAKKTVKTLTDRQLNDSYTKLSKLFKLTEDELNERYKRSLEEEAEIEEEIKDAMEPEENLPEVPTIED